MPFIKSDPRKHVDIKLDEVDKNSGTEKSWLKTAEPCYLKDMSLQGEIHFSEGLSAFDIFLVQVKDILSHTTILNHIL